MLYTTCMPGGISTPVYPSSHGEMPQSLYLRLFFSAFGLVPCRLGVTTKRLTLDFFLVLNPPLA